MKTIAEVIIDLSHSQVDRPFDYTIPADLMEKAREGVRVKVPFKGKDRTGIIFNVKPSSSVEDLKSIEEILSPPLLSFEQRALWEWLREHYACFYSTAVRAMLPREVVEDSIRKERIVFPQRDKDTEEIRKALKRAKKQQKAWEVLCSFCEPPSLRELMDKAQVGGHIIKALESKGLIRYETRSKGRDPLLKYRGEASVTKEPSLQQRPILVKLQAELSAANPRYVLWRSAIGESPFAVYVQLIRDCLHQGKTALLLYPEHRDIEEKIGELLPLFGESLVLLHASLTSQERYHQWWKLKQGPGPFVILGTRSAVFSPVDNLGLAIVHKEENHSYQQLDSPKYQVQEVLERRIRVQGGLLLLNSISPSLQTYAQVQEGKYSYFFSPHREKKRSRAQIVDMRREFARGNISVLSMAVQSALKEMNQKGKNSFLFMNRKGYAPFLLCRNCGYILRCPHCHGSLTFFKGQQRSQCAGCQYQEKPSTFCPRCQSPYFRPFGVGTEKVEEEVQKLLPRQPVMVLDGDRIKHDKDWQAIEERLESAQGLVVVGTQIALKEYVPLFPLVAMISADFFLNVPFYGAREETYHLVQSILARAEEGGEVIIQSYTPEREALRLSVRGEYELFAGKELAYRRETLYPPYVHLFILTFTHVENEIVEKVAHDVAKQFREQMTGSEISLLGPGQASVPRTRQGYRWQLFLKSHRRESILQLLKQGRTTLEKALDQGVLMSLDINPRRML